MTEHTAHLVFGQFLDSGAAGHPIGFHAVAQHRLEVDQRPVDRAGIALALSPGFMRRYDLGRTARDL